MASDAATLLGALAGLRAQLAELDELTCGDAPDADTAALRAELLAAIADAAQAAGDAGGVESDEGDGEEASIEGEAAADTGTACAAPPPRAGVPHTAAPGNAGIHPRNRYALEAPDFAALAARQPVLAPFLDHDASGRAHLDFTDFGATRALTAALLREDFGLRWWIPDGTLCPTLTNRTNYIHWLEDLLALSAPRGAQRVRGVDIGTGASAIYALLGAAMNQWEFVATDVAAEALEWAQRNVAANAQLAHLIEVRDARQAGDAHMHAAAAAAAASDADAAPPLLPLLRGVLRAGERYAFTLCNPPFFERYADAGRNPHTACGGSVVEMVVAGGEAAFIGAHITESAAPELRHAVHWFTTMCGKKATLRSAVAQLRALKAPAVRTTVFAQGRTQRWGLAWSWSDAAGATSRAPLPRAPPGAAAAAAAACAPAAPCTKASFTLRCGRARDAASQVLAALHAACAAAGALQLALNAPAFSLEGRLPLSSIIPPPAKRARVAGAAEAEADEVECEAAFTASVLQQAPGELTVRLALRGARPGGGAPPPARAQAALGALAAAAQRTLTARWPS